jgi:hypothetical protein
MTDDASPPSPQPGDLHAYLATAGIDPTHVLAICTQAARGRRGLGVGTTDGLIVCMHSRRDARTAGTVLTRVGYAIAPAPGGHPRDLLVTGWSPAGLDARMQAMRMVLLQLTNDPGATTRMVMNSWRGLQYHAQTPATAHDLLGQADQGLRSWVSAHCGIHATQNPAIQPQDTRIALRLRATWALEESLDAITRRQLRVAAGVLAAQLRRRQGTTVGTVVEFPTKITTATAASQLAGHARQPSRTSVPGPSRTPSP